MKAKLKAKPKYKKTSEMIEHFEKKGIEVNKESLRSRSKSRRTIADLEKAQDALYEKAVCDSDDDMAPVVDDAKLAEEEAKSRGRNKRTRI